MYEPGGRLGVTKRRPCLPGRLNAAEVTVASYSNLAQPVMGLHCPFTLRVFSCLCACTLAVPFSWHPGLPQAASRRPRLDRVPPPPSPPRSPNSTPWQPSPHHVASLHPRPSALPEQGFRISSSSHFQHCAAERSPGARAGRGGNFDLKPRETSWRKKIGPALQAEEGQGNPVIWSSLAGTGASPAGWS